MKDRFTALLCAITELSLMAGILVFVFLIWEYIRNAFATSTF